MSKQHIIEISPERLSKQLEIAHDINIPVMMHGSPSTSKSKSVEQFCNRRNLELLDIRLSQREFVDLRGIPTVVDRYTHFNPPAELPKQGCKPTVIFLDEINQAERSTQAASYQLLNDRQLGEYYLPDNVWICAAGNYLTDRAIVNRMGSALNNRVMHLYVVIQAEQWALWALKNNIHVSVIAFIRFAPQCLAEMQSVQDDVQNRLKNADAFSSSRTWEFVSKLMHHTNANIDECWPLVAGSVGLPSAIQFQAYIKYYQDLPDFNDIIKDPLKAHIPESRQALLAVSIGLSSRINEQTFGNILKYMGRAPLEYTTAMVNDAIRINDDLLDYPEIAIWIQEHAEILG
jgi:hypothetical protein